MLMKLSPGMLSRGVQLMTSHLCKLLNLSHNVSKVEEREGLKKTHPLMTSRMSFVSFQSNFLGNINRCFFQFLLHFPVFKNSQFEKAKKLKFFEKKIVTKVV
jgi:hypothetical protein